MKAGQVSKALSSDRAVCAVQSRRRDTQDGKGVVQYELVGKTLETSKMVKRPTLLGSLLARVGALPVLPATPKKRGPGRPRKGGAA
jgi:hypothetical protein